MKSMVENRGRWDAGFRSPLLRLVNYSGNLLRIYYFFWGHLKQSKVPESLQGMQ